MKRFCRVHLAATLFMTCVTAWFSYAYFHADEYFQVIEWTRFKLGQVGAGALPWEYASQIRPWLQPFVYWLVARAARVVGVQDLFALAFFFRLLTGLANVGVLAVFLRTTTPWLATDDERRLHVRVATLLGFLPYLFVRTSSESAAMAAFTLAFALLLAGARPPVPGERETWTVPSLSNAKAFGSGVLFGIAFEARFQTAILVLGLVAWLYVVGRVPLRSLGVVVAGSVITIAAAAPIDQWGYGEWCFPPWTYFKANFIEGAAGFFGSDPPFAYAWMLPANVFAPVVVALLVLAVIAWLRCPRHPITWATLPFFAVHNLIPHKEERFLFPMAILATSFVTMAIAPSAGKPLRVSRWGWAHRRSLGAKLLAAFSVAGMLFLAFYPLGWHHHVPFARHVHVAMNDEVRAYALPEFDLGNIAFSPRVYEVEKLEAADIVSHLDSGTGKTLLVSDDPLLRSGDPTLDARGELVYSELPFYENVALRRRLMSAVDAYNAWARPPLRRLRFRSLYRLR